VLVPGWGGLFLGLVRRKRLLATALSHRDKSSRAEGSSKKQGCPCLTVAFDPGRGPVSDPSSRRHHSAARPPLIAPPGPCWSMLALGTIGGSVHEARK